MKKNTIHRMLRAVSLVALLALPVTCFAHTEEASMGFMTGLKHPVFGLDHLLAMVSVGIVSSQLGGANIWRIPSAFVTAMIVGGILGANNFQLAYGELGIALSVVLLGVGIVFADKDTSPLLVTACVIFFGFFHGHAHGEEMPRAAEPVYYTFGFITSTSLLHLFGVGIGEISIRRQVMLKVLRSAGVVMALCGLFFAARASGAL